MNDEILFAEAIALEDFEHQFELIAALAVDDGQRQRVQQLLESHMAFQLQPESQILNQHEEVFQRYLPGHIESDGDGIAEGVKFDKYQLKKKIGEGGMGLVYRARQIYPLDRQVALKLLKPGMDSRKILSRFEHEKQVLQQLSHPGITKIFDAGLQPNGRPFFAMELVEGASSITEFANTNKLDVCSRVELLASVCDIVQHAHQRGVIHRDLKPSNILVEGDVSNSNVKVIDFGIAKTLLPGFDMGRTATHECVGSYEYMSPEHMPWNRQEIDTRSDIYSLGVLLAELLVGDSCLKTSPDEHHAISTVSEAVKRLDKETLAELSAARRVSSRELTRILAGELGWICSKAMSVDKEDRYASVTDFCDDLRRYLAGLPVRAAKTGVVYRTRKFLARNWLLSGVVAMALVCIVSTAVVASVFAYRATNAEREVSLQLAELLEMQTELTAQTQIAKEAHRQSVARNRVIAAEAAFLSAFDEYFELLMVSAKNPEAFQKTRFDQDKCFNVDFLWAPAKNLAVKGDWSWVRSRGILDSYVDSIRLTSLDIQELTSTKHTHFEPDSEGMLKPEQIKELIDLNNERHRLRFQKLVLRELSRKLGKNDPMIAEAIDNCAQECIQQGQYREAAQLLQESINIWNEDDDFPAQRIQAQLFLAFCYEKMGQNLNSKELWSNASSALATSSMPEQDRNALMELKAKLSSNQLR